MPKILIVKTSSMGDVLHNLPAITDISRNIPRAQIDWVVEENFAALPALHPKVNRVIPVAVRRWRRQLWQSRHEIQKACAEMKSGAYDIVLDTQGLLKSAFIARCAGGERYGYDWNSAREPLASLFYRHRFGVRKDLHAVERNRQLAGKALGYEPDKEVDYGIVAPECEIAWLPAGKYAVLLHATSRDDKLWDEMNWIALGQRLDQSGMCVVLPWGSDNEQARAKRLEKMIPGAVCAPKLDLNQAAAMIGKAEFVVGVDTGLSHLAAALGKSTVGIYTATDPGLTGLYGGVQVVNLGGRGRTPSVEQVVETLSDLGFHVQ